MFRYLLYYATTWCSQSAATVPGLKPSRVPPLLPPPRRSSCERCTAIHLIDELTRDARSDRPSGFIVPSNLVYHEFWDTRQYFLERSKRKESAADELTC